MRKLKLLLMAAALLGGVISVNAQKDVTSQYITNATLSAGMQNGWTVNYTGSGNYPHFNTVEQGNNTVGYATEAYAGWGELAYTAYSMTQTITLPAGNYRLVNYSFFRQGQNYDTDKTKSLAFLKAGENKVAIKTLGSINAAGYANSQKEGANCFDSKMYRNVVEFTSDGSPIEIGVEGTFDAAYSWCIVGMFELFDLNDLASVSSPTDMTYAITNPGFEYRDLTGWTNEGFNLITNNDNIGGKSGVAYIEYYKWGGLESNKYISQTLTGLDNGLYEVTVFGHQQQGTPNDGVKLYANSDYTYIGSTTQDYSVRTTVSNNELIIKIQTEGSTANWTAFDKFRLKFYGDPLEAYKDLLSEAVTAAQALIDGAAGSAISATAKAAWQAVVDDNDNSDDAFTEESQFTAAIESINSANTNYQAMAAPYAIWLKVKAGADAMALVANDNATATSTLTTATSDQNTAAEAATTPAALNTAISTLRTAVKTFISATEPTGGASFEITCLVENPSFDNNTVDGWTRTYSSGGNAQTSYTCNEFWNNTFNIYQDLADLPNGSYQLSVQAFSRPGGNDVAYPAYVGGTNSVTAELYVNNDASTVGNIYAYTGNTTGAKVTSGSFVDYKCVVDGGTDYWVPNGMEGANLYFADENVYKTTVAALVEDGNLRIGFRDETLTANQWTIFDNFRLFYYGSDKSVYYAQYLPQLIAEVEADKSNALYANVTGKELSDLNTALGVDASGFTTEQQYSDAIQAIKDAQTAYRAAYPAYDALVAAKAYAALTEITANIGTGVFQYPSNTATLWTTYSSAKTVVDNYTVSATSTAADIQALVDALDNAIEAYEGIALNEPTAGKKYTISMANGSWEVNGVTLNNEAITYLAGAREDMGGYNVSYAAVANPNLAQAFTFTKVSGNNYKLSQLDADGNERYLSTGTAYEGGNASQIRTTTDVAKAMQVTVIPTNEEGIYNLKNVEANALLGAQDAGVYTVDKHNKYSIAEASKASVDVSIDNTVKWATRIFPFTPSLSGVTFYSCNGSDGSTLTLVEEETPAANKPYILYAENGLNSTDLEGWGVLASLEPKTDGWLTGVYANTTAEEGCYVLQNNNGKVGFYQVGSSVHPTIGANRCYLSESAGVRAFFFPNDSGTSGIDAIDALVSGEATIYNAAGAQVPALQKGVNIIKTKSGATRKVMVK